MIKERPIIYGAWAIPKLLDDSKTQTRRLKGLNEFNENPDDWVVHHIAGAEWEFKNIKTLADYHIKCPYGQPGDRLWVRESIEYADGIIGKSRQGVNALKVIYKADGAERWIPVEQIGDSKFSIPSFRTARFMHKWASRITSVISEVRAERLQEITEEDALTEGANGYLVSKFSYGENYRVFKPYHRDYHPLIDHADVGDIVRFQGPNLGFASFVTTNPKSTGTLNINQEEAFEYVGALEPNYRNGFRILWNSLNAKRGYGWDTNPWVWPISFRKI